VLQRVSFLGFLGLVAVLVGELVGENFENGF